MQEVNEALASHNLKAEKVEVVMDISDDAVISITEVRLFVSVENNLQKIWIEQVAEQRLGRAVTVLHTDGGG